MELSAIVNLVYLSARDFYRIEREDKAGKGFVDFIFYPVRYEDKGIILELKVDQTPEEAIKQIKEKDYILRFKGKLGEHRQCPQNILAVGIDVYKRQVLIWQCFLKICSFMEKYACFVVNRQTVLKTYRRNTER